MPGLGLPGEDVPVYIWEASITALRHQLMEAAGAAVEENEMKFSDKIIGNSKFGDFSETEAATAAPTTVPPAPAEY